MRLILALVAHLDLKLFQKKVRLLSSMEYYKNRSIWINLMVFVFEGQEDKAYRVKRSMKGLKQSSISGT